MTEQVEMTRETTLRLAMEYVMHDRNQDNGDPEDNFGTIAELYSIWLEKKYGIKFKLTPTDVAIFSMMIKIARLVVTETKHDNWIDIAGYAACGAETAAIEHGLLDRQLQPSLPFERDSRDIVTGVGVANEYEKTVLDVLKAGGLL